MQAILTVLCNQTIELQSSFEESLYNPEFFQAHSSFFLDNQCDPDQQLTTSTSTFT